MKIGSKLAIIVFSVIAVAHLYRVLFGISVVIDDWSMPQWISALGFVIAGGIAIQLWKES